MPPLRGGIGTRHWRGQIVLWQRVSGLSCASTGGQAIEEGLE